VIDYCVALGLRHRIDDVSKPPVDFSPGDAAQLAKSLAIMTP
jgi:hypothetical protein